MKSGIYPSVIICFVILNIVGIFCFNRQALRRNNRQPRPNFLNSPETDIYKTMDVTRLKAPRHSFRLQNNATLLRKKSQIPPKQTWRIRREGRNYSKAKKLTIHKLCAATSNSYVLFNSWWISYTPLGNSCPTLHAY